VTLHFSALGTEWYVKSCTALWLAAFSWFIGPALYNPLAFSYKDVLEDIRTWGHWIRSEKFQAWLLGQEASSDKGDLNHNNWYSWLNVEPTVLKLVLALYHFLLYATLGGAILLRMRLIEHTSTATYVLPSEGLQWILIILVLLALLYAAKVKREAIVSLVGFVVIMLVLILAYHQGPVTILWLVALLAYSICQALHALLQIALVFWVYAAPIKRVRVSAFIPSSSDMLLLPRQNALLMLPIVTTIARLHARSIAITWFTITAILACICSVPLVVLSLFMFVYLASRLLSVGIDATGEYATVALALILVYLTATFVRLGGIHLLGSASQSTSRYSVSPAKYLLFSLNIGTLHNWLLMNLGAARTLAERAAHVDKAGM